MQIHAIWMRIKLRSISCVLLAMVCPIPVYTANIEAPGRRDYRPLSIGLLYILTNDTPTEATTMLDGLTCIKSVDILSNISETQLIQCNLVDTFSHWLWIKNKNDTNYIHVYFVVSQRRWKDIWQTYCYHINVNVGEGKLWIKRYITEQRWAEICRNHLPSI